MLMCVASAIETMYEPFGIPAIVPIAWPGTRPAVEVTAMELVPEAQVAFTVDKVGVARPLTVRLPPPKTSAEALGKMFESVAPGVPATDAVLKSATSDPAFTV